MMQDHKILTLYSGSGGNSVYIRMAGTAILIDAGKSAKALCNALREIGTDISEIRAIFITHDHHDHVSALEILSKKHRIPIHMTEPSAALYNRYPDSPIHQNLIRHSPVFTEQVGALTVTSFVTPHDSRGSIGYRITAGQGEDALTVGVATDIGYVTEEVRAGLCGCDGVVLESNHDREMLQNGPYPYELKQRILSRRGHLSNRDSADLAASLCAQGTRGFLLAHLSEENNEPTLALEEAQRAISTPGIYIAVADPHQPTELIIPTKEEVAHAPCEIYNPWNA